MTIDPREFEERTINNFMGKQANTPVSSKKQTSLLSFFSSPTPKRAMEGEFTTNNQAGSPLKKKGKAEDTMFDETCLLYEMVSDGVEEGDATMLDGVVEPRAQDFNSFHFADFKRHEETEMETDINSTQMPTCRRGQVLKNFGEEDESTPNDSLSSSADRYKWLAGVRDADGRLPSDSEYNPRTLYIPQSAWSKFTPFERQYWEIKKDLFDTIVFFKKGKFYELYENDADIGSREFDLKMIDRVNMRMVGVPEATFEMWAARFVAAGYKIARVDQTETAVGKSIREKDGQRIKGENIIRRELSCILTAGTVTEPSMLSSDQSSYCFAIKEYVVSSSEVSLGFAILDASTGAFKLSDIMDDTNRTLLETLLIQLQPKEILIEKGKISIETKSIIKRTLPGAMITEAVADREYPSRSKIADMIDTGAYFGATEGSCTWPGVLKVAHDEQKLSFEAFGALLWYLCMLKLDRSMLSYRNFAILDPLGSSSLLIIDGQSLVNLDILPSSLRTSASISDPKKGTLVSIVDHCSTHFGRRLLGAWLCHPLRSSPEISARLDVVDFLTTESGFASQLRDILRTLPDLERSLSRIHSGSIKLKDFIATLDAFQGILHLRSLILGRSTCCLLSSLANAIPIYSNIIDFFVNSFNRDKALEEGSFYCRYSWLSMSIGTIIPYTGVVKDFDHADTKLASIQDHLQSYLNEQGKLLK